MLLQPAPRAPGAPGASPKDTTFTKLFVGGLPYHTTDASLRSHFQGFGDIDEAVVITDRLTGRSRGYGFVTMTDRAAAERACKDPNPNIDGRKANVNLAYLGAKPRSLQPGFAIGLQQLQPTLIQRTYGLAPHYIYPSTIVQPGMVIPATPVPSLSSPYVEYPLPSPAYTYQPPYEQPPYAATHPTTASFVGYGYTATLPSAMSTVPAGPTFMQYQPPPPSLPDRMQ